MSGRLRLVGMTVVRNESDVIEATLRANLALLDRLVVLDDASTDPTPEIVRRLISEGLAVDWVPVEVSWADMMALQNRALRETLRRDDADFLFALDADEVLVAGGRAELEAALAALPPDTAGLLEMAIYVPTEADDWTEIDPLRRLVHRVAAPLIDMWSFKVIVPRGLARRPDTLIHGGNHWLTRRGGDLATHLPEVRVPTPRARVAHFPLRSPDQALAKILNYELQRRAFLPNSGSSTRGKDDDLAPDYRLDRRTLLDLARQTGRPTSPGLVREPLRLPYDRLRYPELIDVNVVARVVTAAQRIAAHVPGSESWPGHRLKALTEANVALREEIAALRGSTSWRLTAPLRAAVRAVRRLAGRAS